ncbi:hypothetical protein KIW84_030602 [Lathyrus oleraceus]|uniref:Uncharacterized protein n=1 Tax=Pisum sativum TaxID=3888 RepID=A0A9D4XQW0_PEA|nr:hypothetical protein KIW84_030602 [Pisum sativum]
MKLHLFHFFLLGVNGGATFSELNSQDESDGKTEVPETAGRSDFVEYRKLHFTPPELQGLCFSLQQRTGFGLQPTWNFSYLALVYNKAESSRNLSLVLQIRSFPQSTSMLQIKEAMNMSSSLKFLHLNLSVVKRIELFPAFEDR